MWAYCRIHKKGREVSDETDGEDYFRQHLKKVKEPEKCVLVKTTDKKLFNTETD